MSTLNPAPEYGLIRASGSDARQFLQQQLTNDLNQITPQRPLLAAWCNAKGRVLAIFQIVETDDGFILRLPRALIPLTLPRLKMFVLRAKVCLDEIGDDAPPPELSAAPTRLVRIQSGIPEISPETRETFTPQMLNLDLLGGISFKKGCYPGQEVVAKTHYRGLVKRRVYSFRRAGDAGIAPIAGSSIHAAGEPEAVGEVLEAVVDSGTLWLSAVVKLGAAHAALYLPDRSEHALTCIFRPNVDGA